MTVGDQPLICRRNGGGKMIYVAFLSPFITDTDAGSSPSKNQPHSKAGELPRFPGVPQP